MTQDATKDASRMTIRFTPDDLAWIAEQANDEGVDNATMVRMIVNRLRRGRAPLVSMMGVQPALPANAGVVYEPRYLHEGPASEADPVGDADDVLASRLSEIDQNGGAEVIALQQPEGEAAAMPLRRVERQRFNPGRK